MTGRDPNSPGGPEREDGGLDPIERPHRLRGGDAARPARSFPDRDRPDRPASFPWRTGGGTAGSLAGLESAREDVSRRRAGSVPVGGRDDTPGAPLSGPALPSDATAPRAGHARSGPTTPRADDPTDPAAWAEATDAWAAESNQGWEEVAPTEALPAPPTQRRTRAPARPRRAARPTPSVSLPTVRLPAFVARSDLLADRTALGLLGAGLFSAAVMAALLNARLGGLPDSLVIHLDAAGQPDRWGEPRVLWRLPLLAVMTTLINLVVAWLVSPIDQFAGRFLLAATLVVHLIAWVGLFDFL